MELSMFEEKIKEIFFYCRIYGAYTLFEGKEPTEEFDSEELERLCYDGFKIAQSKILAELRDLQKERQGIKQKINQAKRERNTLLLSELTMERDVLDYQSQIFKNFADSIAWQLLRGQHYFYRRLFTHDIGEKDLNDKSFEYVIDFARKINEDRDSFCLITDITNNIQLGDCLIVDKEGIKVSEIKSGDVNFRALELIEKEQLDEDNVDSILGESYDDGFKKQVKRILSQKGKNQRAAKIIRDNEGPDPKFKDSIVKIIETDFEPETYHFAIKELLNKLENKDWAYDCIQGIVHIGVYKNEWKLLGAGIMKDLCRPYYFVDLMESRGMIISEPIFLKPFTEKQIVDIVLDRVKIFIGINYEKFIEFSNSSGVKASWSTSRELHTYLDNKTYNPKEIFSFENRGIKLDILGKQMFIGQGFFIRIIFDQILPSSMLLKYQNQLAEGIDDE